MKINNPIKIANRKALEEDIRLYRLNGGPSGDLNYRINQYNLKYNDKLANLGANFADMFSGCTTFNMPLDSWDISSVVSLSDVFKNTQK